MARTTQTVEVDGRRLGLSNLEKVLYPATGTTKAEVVAYYTSVAPVLLPRLVVDVRHLGHTDGGRLRQPVVLGFRADLSADDVREEL